MIGEVIAYAIVGTGAGILGGLLGITGGFVAIPCLLLIFHFIGLPTGYLMQLAVGTSLASMTFNALASTWAHHLRGNVMWSVVKKMSAGVVIGCLIGAILGAIVSSILVEMIFGLFAILMGIHYYRQKQLFKKNPAIPSTMKLNGIGLGIGMISTFVGIGGGPITMPMFSRYRISTGKAVGTSLALGFIISLFGAIAYLIVGLGETIYADTIGYIYIPAFIVLSITSFFAAPYGARLTTRLSPTKFKRIFGIALILVGIGMLLR